MTETQVDDLLRAFQDACESAVRAQVRTDTDYWERASLQQHRAILRNELRASLLERHRDGERLDRPAPSEKSCLVCGQVRPFAVWHGPSGAGVCQQCRDARHALRGGATMETPKTHGEFMAALDRIIQHYLGDHGARYGDARFVLDYALSLEDEIQRLRASHRNDERDTERLDWLEDRIIEAAGRMFYIVDPEERGMLKVEMWGAMDSRALLDAAMSAPPSPERASK